MADRESSGRRAATILALLAGALAGACGDPPGASVSIRLHASPPPISGRCPGTVPPVPAAIPRGPEGATTVRLTFRRSGPEGGLICDAVLPLEGTSKLVGVPGREDELPPVDLLVEAFRGDATAGAVLVGSGETRGVVLAEAREVRVFVAAREAFGCTSSRLIFGRAFHSATTLPTGEVVILGGLVADPTTPATTIVDQTYTADENTVGGYYATSAVEIYDPASASFRLAPVANLQPRAFHEAYLIPSDGATPQILLVGGITVPRETVPAVDGIRDRAEPLRLVPGPDALPAPTELLTYDPVAGTFTASTIDSGLAAFAPRMMNAATRPPALLELAPEAGAPPSQWPPVVAGGWAAMPASYTGTFEIGSTSTPGSLGEVPLAATLARVGATVTRTGPDTALVWGGNLASAPGSEGTEVGNVLTGLGGSPMAFPATLAGAPPSPRAFHTATALGADTVLVVGGFSVAGFTTQDPAAPFAQLVSVAGTTATVTELASPEGSVPVGYHDAVTVLGGDVLVTGGSPAQAPGCDLFCAAGDAYRGGAGGLDRLPAGLVLPRWGHRTATLLDGTVLVTGGFRDQARDGGSDLVTVPDAEVFSPRTEALDLAAGDPGLASGAMVRVPGDVARTPEGTPALPCPVLDYRD